ncbi:hypothetical protein GCM10023142_12900 [Anaerocolumna aminovalerica]|jgi:hypothetical protein|uniref:Putative methyltransferase n=1 Tax=Anaerocolumna aminovalerica TaxID=1527 RepID=A0A1I5DLZ2_9FIRM|nr:hypothetical protein [Anaerocolumna aminovalerica]MBU5332229.1 hypothetical protein [Anaerocolumna aminovalerica]MDU6263933.1 hypothetical protein [Anaerocolumna aminovalerica]SFO00147.1 Putative methyltransferase [Anaerocolumna aminovalerica]
MITSEMKDKILNYYNDGGKHSSYQNYPTFVTKALGITAKIDENWRGDSKRYQYIKENLTFPHGIVVGDIGANTGRFCLDFAMENEQTDFVAIEINENNTNFIKMICDMFQINNVKVLNESAGLDNIDNLPNLDIAFHMNVLHHTGVDFECDQVRNVNELKNYIITYLRKFKEKCNIIVFQLGYNWGGNKNTPIVSSDCITDMIEYQKNVFLQSGYEIVNMGLYHYDKKEYINVPVETTKEQLQVVINNLSMNLNSEFYKRPIFILKSSR